MTLADDPEARLLDALYLGAIQEDALQDALGLMQALFRGNGAAFVSMDTPGNEIALASGMIAENMRAYAEQFGAIDPAPAAFARLEIGKAAATDEMFDADLLRTDPVLNEFLQPLGMVETLGGTLLRDRGRFSLIGLQRGDDREAFDTEDRRRLERLMPHIARVLQLRREFERLRGLSTGLQAMIDRLAAGVALLDEACTALFVNAALRAMARSADGLALDRAGKPVPGAVAARQRLEVLLRDVAAGGAGGILAVPRPSGARDYSILVAPSLPSFATTGWEGKGRPASLVIVHDPAVQRLAPVEMLEQALKLPPGAARLTAAMVEGHDLKAFADREGVTIHTARFHLHTALARTGTHSQAELVRLVTRLLRDLTLEVGGG